MPERRANANLRACVSKDEDEQSGLPSCFEAHRRAGWQWKELDLRRAAMLLSMKAGEAVHFVETNSLPSSPRKRGPMHTGRCSSVPALATLGRDDDWLSILARRTQF